MSTTRTPRREPVVMADLFPGDRIEVDGFPETVRTVRKLGGSMILARTESSVILRPASFRVELLTEAQ